MLEINIENFSLHSDFSVVTGIVKCSSMFAAVNLLMDLPRALTSDPST